MLGKFIIRTFACILTVVCLFAAAFALIPSGRIGDVYARITSPSQQSLVIGTSRAAQAVNPEIINTLLKDTYPASLYNYSFHLDASTFNTVYEEAIYSKLAPYDGKRSIFIIAVDPWALRQLDSIPQELKLKSYSGRPNLEYLIKNFNRGWFTPLPTHSFVNGYGRTEVDYTPKSKAEWEARVKARIKAYEGMAETYKYSDESQQIAERIIRNLKKRSDVVLVRIPVSAPMLALENSICSDFDQRIHNLADSTEVKYFNFTGDDYQTTDGNHLTQEEGNRFSKALADSIKAAHFANN